MLSNGPGISSALYQKLNQLLAPNLSWGTKSLETFGPRAWGGEIDIPSHYTVHSASLQGDEVKVFFFKKRGKDYKK